LKNPFLSGAWHSRHHPISLVFNEHVWQSVAGGHDDADTALLGLFCEQDGASFSLDYSIKDSTLDYDYSSAEAEFYSRIIDLDPHATRLASDHLEISQLHFVCNRYVFQNKQFGNQIVTRALHINHTFLIAIGMAWPHKGTDPLLNPRFKILLDKLNIHTL